MVGLTDSQLKLVMDATRTLPAEKRDLYLQRIGAMLAVRGYGHFDDVSNVTTLALAGLVHAGAA